MLVTGLLAGGDFLCAVGKLRRVLSAILLKQRLRPTYIQMEAVIRPVIDLLGYEFPPPTGRSPIFMILR
jgi:hypothetical protein